MSKAAKKVNSPQPSDSCGSADSEENYLEPIICPTTPDKCVCSEPCAYNTKLISTENKNHLVKLCKIYVDLEKKEEDYNARQFCIQIDQCIDSISEPFHCWHHNFVIPIIDFYEQMIVKPIGLFWAIEKLRDEYQYKTFFYA